MIYTIFIVPLLMIVVGYFMFKNPPKKINIFIGYRTFRSMKNNYNWEFANKYCGSLWIKIGLVMLFISGLLFLFDFMELFDFNENFLAVFVLCEVIPIILSGIIIENILKNFK